MAKSPTSARGAIRESRRSAGGAAKAMQIHANRAEAPVRAKTAKKGVKPVQGEIERSSPAPANLTRTMGRLLRPQAASRWLLPSLASITPQYIENILRGALAGDHVRQWELFDIMQDTWPELAAVVQELTYAVCQRLTSFEPWREEGESPTPSALERCALVSGALRRMRPEPSADENDLDGTIKDIAHGWFCGVTALEIEWWQTRAGALGTITAPRCTYWVHPVCYAWTQDGRIGLRQANGSAPSPAAGMAITTTPGNVTPFPENKFLIGIHKSKSGSALGGALLRPLAWWWCAANFSSDWLLNLAQLFGLPFRWAQYDPNAPDETISAICSMLQNMGSAGWAAFPSGTTLELKDPGKSGDRSPQGDLLDRADRYARLLVLGQTMSGGSGTTGKGGGQAFGAVESEVKATRVDACSKYVAGVINAQMIPAILRLNYGDDEECPSMTLIEESEGDLQAAQRDQILSGLLPLSRDFLRKKYNQPEPEEGEDATATPATTQPDPEDKQVEPEKEEDGGTGDGKKEEDGGTDGGKKEDAGGTPTLPGKSLSAKLRHICAIGDDAIFAKELKAICGIKP